METWQVWTSEVVRVVTVGPSGVKRKGSVVRKSAVCAVRGVSRDTAREIYDQEAAKLQGTDKVADDGGLYRIQSLFSRNLNYRKVVRLSPQLGTSGG